jgi:hypothetical protein
MGKWSPCDEQYYSTSPFWKTRWEMTPMYTIASRTPYPSTHSGSSSGALPLAIPPKQKMHARDKKITIPHLPEFLAKTRSAPTLLSPSPTSYTIPTLMGCGKKISIQNRHLDSGSFRKSVAQPGPAEYSINLALGQHRPRYSLGGRTGLSAPTRQHPGPASYNIKNLFDRYNISPPDYVPVFMRPKNG